MRSTIGVLAAAVLASCSGGGTQSHPNQTAAGYAVFTGNVHLAGEIRVDGQFTDSITGRGETCGQFAEGIVPATTLWVTPTPNDAEVVAGHKVSFTAGVTTLTTAFHGPGIYAQPEAQVDVLLVDNSSFLPGDHPTTVVTVTSSGSGSMVFSDMTDVDSGQVETGAESWTCTSATTASSPNAISTQTTVVPVGAPILSGSLVITGAYPSSATFTTRAEVDGAGLSARQSTALTCGDYGRGTPATSSQSRSFVAPEIDTGGDNGVYFDVMLSTGYAGPGMYSSQAFPALTGNVAITIPPASAPQVDTFTSRDGGSIALNVRADGSGVVLLTDWGSNASDSRISGNVSWQCSAGG